MFPAPFNLEATIATINQLIVDRVGKPLSPLQKAIIQCGLTEGTYEDLAQKTGWSEQHIKAVGASLWELLTEVFQEPVRKKTLRFLLEHRYSDLLLKGIAATPSLVDTSVEKVTSSLEFPDGPVQLGSALYCDRLPIESRCYAAIVQPGVLLRIRAPRQMGKTSLLNRILHQAEQQGYSAVSLNLQLVDQEILQDLDRFLQWFCARVAQALKLPSRLADYWDDIFGSKTCCKDYFENYLLPNCSQPLVLALDEVDALFAHPAIANDFFALLRAWYEESKNSELWQTLRLILVHSTDIYIPLQIHQSPFNVGIPIELPEFNAEQVKILVHRHGLNWTAEQVEQLMVQVGGHPYLVRMALYHITQMAITLDSLLSMTLTTGPFYNHLQRQLSAIEQQPNLVTALKAILAQESFQLKSLELFQLHRIGLIQTQNGQARIRCELYRRWLQDEL